MNLSDFIKERLSFESYAFNWDQLLIAKADKSEISMQSQLSYAIQKGDIIPLRHHFYLIIPPRYSKFGKLPIDKFFTVSNWPTKNIVLKKADAGMYKISGPCLTAVDLI